MGEAATAVTDDAYASNWNPAALVRLKRSELALTHQNSFQDVQEQNLNLAFPISQRLSGGLYVIRRSVDDFTGYDASGNEADSVNSSDGAYGGALGVNVTPALSFGGALKFIRSTLGPSSASSPAFDVAALYRWRAWSLGTAFQNFGSALIYDREKTKLPQTSRIGLGRETVFHQSPWIVAADYNFSPDHASYWTLGQEFWFKRILALRAGYRFGQDEGSGIRMGVGIGIKSVQISYSISPFGLLGDTHRFGINFQFGPTLAPAPAKKVLPPPVVNNVPVVVPTPAPAPSPTPAPNSYWRLSTSTSSSIIPIGPIVPIQPLLNKPIGPSKPATQSTPVPLYKSKQRLLPGTAKELTDRGSDYLKQGRYNEAAVAFGQALRIEPNNKTALELMRKALNELDRNKKREKGVYE
jgi:tetratricopeptide (TPR) repeat protein